MHTALLIDEILQVILEICSDWTQQEYRSSLCQLARCCKAWCDPALDKLWSRLDGIMPLLRLLPNAGLHEMQQLDENTLTRFRTYAARVRSIQHIETTRVPLQYRLLISLPKLSSVRFRNNGCQTVDSWGISGRVCEVDISLGFSRRRASPGCPDDTLTRYLDTLRQASSCVRTMRIRGLVSEELLRSVARYTTLRTLDLRVGPALAMETFVAIATTFVHLREVTVDARHLDAQGLCEAFRSPTTGTEIYPSLRDLTLQAKPALASTLLQFMQSSTLESFHLDAHCSSDAAGSVSLAHMFAHLPGSLRALSLECFDDLSFDPSSLHPLKRLAGLRRLNVQLAVMPCLSDQDAKDWTTWWPKLEHFSIGAVEDVCPPRGYGMTPAAYVLFAISCPALRSLALPVHIPGSADELPDAATLVRTPSNEHERPRTAVSRHALERLDIGMRKAPPSSVTEFCDYIRVLFPSLTSVEIPGFLDIDLLQQTACDRVQPTLVSYYQSILTHQCSGIV